MKKNKDFVKFDKLVEEYYESGRLKSKKEEVTFEVINLISKGWATRNLKVVYDLSIEKFRSIGLEDMAIKIYDKDKSVKGILRGTFGDFMPKSATDFIPYKELIFDPFKPISFTSSGIEYANLYIPSKFLSYKASENEMIDFISWNKYLNIKHLFLNVFKTMDRMDYFVNWLAYCFQTKRKARTAIVSRGIQGAGKGVIFSEIIEYAIGDRYIAILENEALKSRFNGELENKLFVLANEIKGDFRDGNTIYERLKMYISDDVIRIEEKNVKARSVSNYFNIWFHSNHNVPLQIQGNDRRYTVFNTKDKKLTEVARELDYTHISFYIEAIKRERDEFIYDLMKLKYDLHQATTPMLTEEKEVIYELSMNKIDILLDKIKAKNIEYFKEHLEDFYESSDLENVKQLVMKIYNINNAMDFVKELQKQFNGNYIKNDMAKILYKILVNENDGDRKIGLNLNTLGKAIYKKINNKAFKYRKIDEDKEVVFNHFQSIPLVVEDENGKMIKNDLLVSNREEVF